MKLLSLLAILVLAVASAHGAEPLSLPKTVETVRRENPSVKAARARWEAMKERIPQAQAWDDPMAVVVNTRWK